jgi:hypothetical protein
MAGSQVISGAINGDAALVIRAEKLAVIRTSEAHGNYLRRRI